MKNGAVPFLLSQLCGFKQKREESAGQCLHFLHTYHCCQPAAFLQPVAWKRSNGLACNNLCLRTWSLMVWGCSCLLKYFVILGIPFAHSLLLTTEVNGKAFPFMFFCLAQCTAVPCFIAVNVHEQTSIKAFPRNNL